MTMPGGPAQWHVLGDQITQTTVLAPGGQGLQDVYEVPFIIDTGPAAGHRGVVNVPVGQLNQANVARLVADQVSTVHDIGGLSG
jgi:hypothetical protein